MVPQTPRMGLNSGDRTLLICAVDVVSMRRSRCERNESSVAIRREDEESIVDALTRLTKVDRETRATGG